MIEDLLEVTASKKESILKKLEEIEKERKEIKPPWEDSIINELKGKRIAAEDGSINWVDFRTFTLYAVASQLFYFDEKMENIKACDVDILWPCTRSEERLRFYMHIFETKVCLEAIRKFNPDLILLDGSLIGMLIRPFPSIFEPPVDVRRDVEKNFLEILNENLENGIEIFSKKLWSDVEEKFPNFKIEVICYLEYLEHLLCVYKLLSNAKDKIVAIAKTSRANDYFNLGIPDMAIFEKYSKKEGISKPLQVGNVKWKFPILDEELKRFNFTIFYSRLEDRKNILKFEIPSEIDEKQAKEILENIKSISTDGYPYLLKKAHDEVIIKKKDIEHLVRMFGLVEKIGREML
ncbi:MAG: DNA double-strand break repair nuclease NurA [Candidatus Aenigmatarchaeota archaeon]